MPQPFTQEQMERIRGLLFESACRYAIQTGVKKTSLEQLTTDAGISKSTFYKFFDSKEELFILVGQHYEMLILNEARRGLIETKGQSNRERTAAAVNAAFDKLAELEALPFLREDMPRLLDYVDEEERCEHFHSMSLSILELLRGEGIRFAIRDEIVAAVIHILYLSIQHIQEIDSFTEALRELVLGACDRVVE